ncbi:MAG: ferrous iron transport protein A [Endomicrobium sp.]|jgi:Fe2+ transport system protein FeoA|nr:ferrous iron transport protein A [Endomicrobium sp.]
MFRKFFMKRLRKRLKMARELRCHFEESAQSLYEKKFKMARELRRHFEKDAHHHHPHIHKHYDPDRPLISLSVAKKGEYEFITTLCEHEMEHRLMEMGFIPQTKIKVIENPDSNGAVFIEIKGSKLALNAKIANDILVTEIKENI